MSKAYALKPPGPRLAGDDVRERLLAGIPVTEQRMVLAGISTAVLEGGSGPTVVLLHGPGEYAAKWMRVIPDLVETHRVVAPDLPGHGTSEVVDGEHGLMGQFGMPAIPPDELAQIPVPTALIWGRHDLATPLAVAEAASAHYGWPLHVIEEAADDPAMEQPEAFLKALCAVLVGNTRAAGTLREMDGA